MKKYLSAFENFLLQITKDAMSIICLIAPILMGLSFRFLIPFLEKILCNEFQKAVIISPYYAIFDMLLAIMTPILFCFAGVLVILEEMDNGTSKYYYVTPVGKSGYFLSRLVIPVVIASLYDVLLLFLFSLTNVSIVENLIYSVSGALMSIISALLVIAFAKNKMEGMALIKMCGLLFLGIPIVYFIKSPIQYVFSFLPSYWMAKISATGNIAFLLPTVLTSAIIILFLFQKFLRKI